MLACTSPAFACIMCLINLAARQELSADSLQRQNPSGSGESSLRFGVGIDLRCADDVASC